MGVEASSETDTPSFADLAESDRLRGIVRMSNVVKRQVASAHRDHYNMKVIIRGDRATGKSSLLRRLQGLSFDAYHVVTPEITVGTLNWEMINNDKVDSVKIEVWDVVDVAPKLPAASSTPNPGSTGLVMEHGRHRLGQTDASTIDVLRDTHAVIYMVNPFSRDSLDYIWKQDATIPDDMVVLILLNFKDLSDADTSRVRVSMADVNALAETMRNRSHGSLGEGAARRCVHASQVSLATSHGVERISDFMHLPLYRMQHEALKRKMLSLEELFLRQDCLLRGAPAERTNGASDDVPAPQSEPLASSAPARIADAAPVVPPLSPPSKMHSLSADSDDAEDRAVAVKGKHRARASKGGAPAAGFHTPRSFESQSKSVSPSAPRESATEAVAEAPETKESAVPEVSTAQSTSGRAALKRVGRRSDKPPPLASAASAPESVTAAAESVTPILAATADAAVSTARSDAEESATAREESALSSSPYVRTAEPPPVASGAEAVESSSAPSETLPAPSETLPAAASGSEEEEPSAAVEEAELGLPSARSGDAVHAEVAELLGEILLAVEAAALKEEAERDAAPLLQPSSSSAYTPSASPSGEISEDDPSLAAAATALEALVRSAESSESLRLGLRHCTESFFRSEVALCVIAKELATESGELLLSLCAEKEVPHLRLSSDELEGLVRQSCSACVVLGPLGEDARALLEEVQLLHACVCRADDRQQGSPAEEREVGLSAVGATKEDQACDETNAIAIEASELSVVSPLEAAKESVDNAALEPHEEPIEQPVEEEAEVDLRLPLEPAVAPVLRSSSESDAEEDVVQVLDASLVAANPKLALEVDLGQIDDSFFEEEED